MAADPVTGAAPQAVPPADPARRALEALSAGRAAEAEALYRQILAERPLQAGLWNNLAIACESAGRPAELVAAAYRMAAAVDPGYIRPQTGLGGLAFGRGLFGPAIRHWDRAARIEPDNGPVLFNLGVALQMSGDAAAAAAAFRRAVALQPGNASVWSQYLLCLNYLDLPGTALLAAHRQFAGCFPPSAPPPAFANSRDPDRRLRVGYLSVEFRSHLGSYFLLPLLEGHDRGAVEVTCYSLLPGGVGDALTRRFQTLADRWRPVDRLDDDALAALIREDGIDILVDLAGHSGLNRLPMLARRAAPVQVTWLGYPNTTGMDCVDYRIVDPVSDPPGGPGIEAADAHAAETLVRLPAPFLCFRPPADAPAMVPLPAGARGAVTFGSFNKLAKITEDTVALWAAVLRAAPDTRLLLKDKPLSCPDTAQAWRDRFARHGIDPGRLDLLGWIADPGGHLAAYNRIDIALDPHPYNGTITTCDTLWMGAPLVTLRGSRHAARVGASLLTAVGLPELVADTPDAYVAAAAGLAGDLTRLMRLRLGMRARVAASPLCDEGRFLRNLEAGYRMMWRRWCADGAGPA